MSERRVGTLKAIKERDIAKKNLITVQVRVLNELRSFWRSTGKARQYRIVRSYAVGDAEGRMAILELWNDLAEWACMPDLFGERGTITLGTPLVVENARAHWSKMHHWLVLRAGRQRSQGSTVYFDPESPVRRKWQAPVRPRPARELRQRGRPVCCVQGQIVESPMDVTVRIANVHGSPGARASVGLCRLRDESGLYYVGLSNVEQTGRLCDLTGVVRIDFCHTFGLNQPGGGSFLVLQATEASRITLMDGTDLRAVGINRLPPPLTRAYRDGMWAWGGNYRHVILPWQRRETTEVLDRRNDLYEVPTSDYRVYSGEGLLIEPEDDFEPVEV